VLITSFPCFFFFVVALFLNPGGTLWLLTRENVTWTEGGCYAWDVAAGWCILNEAGGIMVSGNPGDWNPAIDSRIYLAVRGAKSGQKEIVEEFWRVIGDGKMDYKH
jgi:myo-inositol-1(or 4)-monophosphatase